MTTPDTVGAAAGARRNLAVALALMIVGGVIWGGTFTLAKLVTEAGVHPFGLALWVSVIAVVILLPYVLLRHGGVPLGRDHVQVYVVAGTLGTALPSSVLFFVAAHMPAGIMAIIVSLVPLMTYGIALAIGVERLAGLRAAGIGLGFVAILMIAVPDASLPDRAMVPWAVFALIAPLSYSAENVYLAIRRPSRSSPFVLLCGMMIAGSLILLPVVWVSDGWVSLDVVSAIPWWWIPALSVINIIGYVMFLELIRMAGPLFAAQMGYVVTAAGVLWGVAIFDESHSVWIWAALAVLFAGVALVNPRRVGSAR